MAGSLMGPATGLTNSKLAMADADAAHVLEGKGFFAGDKILKTGKMKNNGQWPNPDKVAMYDGSLRVYKEDGYTEGGISIPGDMLGTADNSCVLVGRTYTSVNGLKSTGTMPNNGAFKKTLDPGESVTIRHGYHNGAGTISARSLTANDVIGKVYEIYLSTIIGGDVHVERATTFRLGSRRCIGVSYISVNSGSDGTITFCQIIDGGYSIEIGASAGIFVTVKLMCV